MSETRGLLTDADPGIGSVLEAAPVVDGAVVVDSVGGFACECLRVRGIGFPWYIAQTSLAASSQLVPGFRVIYVSISS